ncbi:hypothetical protein ACFW2V_12690 [Streptomyces sp. NPDC058947]|uniref:hypothetical protein n=1 Tax=Streptomyces sp. NPDC058947 TaxID=3346675 RepID=UPI0036A41A7B
MVEIPVKAEVTVVSIRWAVQSRAGEGDPWYTENDNTPGLPGKFEEAARKLLRVYRESVDPGRECRLVKRTTACYDEPVED